MLLLAKSMPSETKKKLAKSRPPETIKESYPPEAIEVR